MGKLYVVLLHCTEFPLKHKCFIQRCPRPNERTLNTMSLYIQYARVSSCFFYAILQCKPLHLTLGNCIQRHLHSYIHRMCFERQVFYPTISQRSCHVQHCTCTQNVTIYSLLNIQEFEHSVCAFTYNIIAILPCTCTENVANHFMFNINEFRSVFIQRDIVVYVL